MIVVQTEWQRQFLLQILKAYMKMRKSHFYSCSNGLKQKKISDELVCIEGWIEELKQEKLK